MIVALDWQHAGKPHAKRDRGAAYDQDGDGLISPHEHEVWFTGLDVNNVAAFLIGHGHTPIVVADGTYKQRAARAAAMGARLLICHHRNAGRGDYGFVGFDKRTRKGPDGLSGVEVAYHIATHLQRAFPEALSEVRRVACSPTHFPRAYSTIKHAPAGLIAICFEPGFLDNPRHAPLNSGSGSRKLSEALVNGINAAERAARPIS